MKITVLSPVIFFAVAILSVSSAFARFPLTGTIPKEQDITMFCSVDDALLAKDCGPPPQISAGRTLDKRAEAFVRRTIEFIRIEAATPDYLVGATPGVPVQVIIRRSTAAQLDAANPGRAVAPASPPPAPVTDPDWAVMPNDRDLDGYFPDRALRLSISGEAQAQCTVGADGDLLGCWVTNPNPTDTGFGPTVLRVSTFLKMKPLAKDGSPVVGRAYTLRAVFNARNGRITLSAGR